MSIKKIIPFLSGSVLFFSTGTVTAGSHYSYKLILPDALSHPNLTENLYFTNEMMKAQMEFNEFNGRLREEKHELNFFKNDEEKPFWSPVIEEKTFKENYTFKNIVLENRTDREIETPPLNLSYKIDTHKLTLASYKSLSSEVEFDYQKMEILVPANNEYKNSWAWSAEEEEKLPPHKLLPNTYLYSEISIENTVTYRQKFLYIPLANDKILQTIVDNFGRKYSFTPTQLQSHVENVIGGNDYYLGNNEFLQLRSKINGGPWAKTSLLWVAWKFEEWEVKLDHYKTDLYVGKSIEDTLK